MHDHAQEKAPGPAFRNLYPTLSDEELIEAEKNLTHYFEIALDICRDLRANVVDSSAAERIIKERSKELSELN
jgi:hypothetical protein